METRNLTELTDEELLQEAKKRKSTSIINAMIIGFLAGVVVYSFVNKSLGFLTLIPLYFAYKVFTGSKSDSGELERLLKERNLK